VLFHLSLDTAGRCEEINFSLFMLVCLFRECSVVDNGLGV